MTDKHIDWIKSIGQMPKTVDNRADAYAVLSRSRLTMFRVWEVLFKRDGDGERINDLPEEAQQVIRNLYNSIQEIDFFLGGVAAGIEMMEKEKP